MGSQPDFSLSRIQVPLCLIIEFCDFDNFICWQYGWNSFFQRGLRTGQAALLKKYNIPHDKNRLHDALYDIEMNFKIFRKQLFNIEL